MKRYLFGFLSVPRASYNRNTPHVLLPRDGRFFHELSEEYFSFLGEKENRDQYASP